MGVSQGIADGLMGRCAMKWSTAGTNRVCSRCLALKDTIVGYTDESGVTIPPLHPRCRCAIIYDEVAAPRRIDNKPKPAKPETKPKPAKPETKPETKPTPIINPLLIPATVPTITPVAPPKPEPNKPSENVTPMSVSPLNPATSQPEMVLPQDIESKSFDELQDYVGKLDDLTVRKWYIYHDERIHEQIDSSLPIEEKAHQAFTLRNTYRNQARELMADQEKRRELDEKHPNPTWEEILKHKTVDKSMTYEEAIKDIYETATKSNANVNRSLGLE